MSEQAGEEDFCKNGNHIWMGSMCKDCAKPVPTTVQTLYWAAAALAGKEAKLAASEAGAAAMREELEWLAHGDLCQCSHHVGVCCIIEASIPNSAEKALSSDAGKAILEYIKALEAEHELMIREQSA